MNFFFIINELMMIKRNKIKNIWSNCILQPDQNLMLTLRKYQIFLNVLIKNLSKTSQTELLTAWSKNMIEADKEKNNNK